MVGPLGGVNDGFALHDNADNGREGVEHSHGFRTAAAAAATHSPGTGPDGVEAFIEGVRAKGMLELGFEEARHDIKQAGPRHKVSVHRCHGPKIGHPRGGRVTDRQASKCS